MRRILVISGCLLSSLLSAQFVSGQSVEYTYDNAGNRVLREPWDPNSGSGTGPDEGIATGRWKMQTDLMNQAARFNASNAVDSEVFIYPNPTSSSLKVEFTDTSTTNGAKTLILYSPTGATIFSKKITSDQNLIEIDLTTYSAGLYLIEIRSSSDNKRYSIIKE